MSEKTRDPPLGFHSRSTLDHTHLPTIHDDLDTDIEALVHDPQSLTMLHFIGQRYVCGVEVDAHFQYRDTQGIYLRMQLLRAGLVMRNSVGLWHLTPLGQAVVEQHPLKNPSHTG